MLSASWTNDVRVCLLGKRSNALINRSAPAAAKNSRDLLADATPALVSPANEEWRRHIQSLSNTCEAANRDPVCAVLVLLHLLEAPTRNDAACKYYPPDEELGRALLENGNCIGQPGGSAR